MILTVCANPAIDRVYFVDDFKIGEVHRPKSISVTAGGKGLNVARVASILGGDVFVAGFIGGKSGEYISEEFKKTSIKDMFVRTNKETRTCVNISDNKGNSSEILENGLELNKSDEDKFIKTFSQAVPKADIITISGSQPKGLSEDFYVKLLDVAKSNNKKCIIDTSGDTLNRVIDAKPFMVKPNRFELGQYMGVELKTISDCQKALTCLYEKDVEIPLCTLGSEGALMYFQNRFIRFITPTISPVNSVGSGDSVVAGMAFGLSQKFGIIDCIKYGMAAGITNALYQQTGFVDKKTVDKYFEQIDTVYL